MLPVSIMSSEDTRRSDPRVIHAGQLMHAAYRLTAYGVAAVLVDRLIAKAFRLSQLALDDERKFGGGR